MTLLAVAKSFKYLLNMIRDTIFSKNKLLCLWKHGLRNCSTISTLTHSRTDMFRRKCFAPFLRFLTERVAQLIHIKTINEVLINVADGQSIQTLLSHCSSTPSFQSAQGGKRSLSTSNWHRESQT